MKRNRDTEKMSQNWFAENSEVFQTATADALDFFHYSEMIIPFNSIF